MAIQRLKTVYFLGSLINNIKGIFNKTNELVDAVNSLETSTIPDYKVYRALLTQSGTNPPIEDDLDGSGTGLPFEDTINGVWSYITNGRYLYTKTGLFADVSKIDISISNNNVNNSPTTGVRFFRIDNDSIEMQTGTLGSFANPTIFTEADNLIYLQQIEIRVYN